MMKRVRLTLAVTAILILSGAAVAQTQKPATCEVKLASEIERSDAQQSRN